MLEWLTGNFEGIVTNFGQIGIFLAMAFPLTPSEIAMPLAGYLALSTGQGYFGLATMILAGALGSTVGAIIIYLISREGEELIIRYGKWVLFNEKRIADAHRWFERHGELAVLLGRMTPVIRELISIPAGLARMTFWKFVAFTFAGSLVWAGFLGSLGYFFADTWRSFVGSNFNLFGVAVVVAIVGYLLFRHLWKGRR